MRVRGGRKGGGKTRRKGGGGGGGGGGGRRRWRKARAHENVMGLSWYTARLAEGPPKKNIPEARHAHRPRLLASTPRAGFLALSQRPSMVTGVETAVKWLLA